MTTKEKLIKRLNNGFNYIGIDIDKNTSWRYNMNQHGYRDGWAFAFIPLIECELGRIQLGSYKSAKELISAEKLIIEKDCCGDYNIWDVPQDYVCRNNEFSEKS